jgi:ferredoxin-like protein FixX
MDLDDQFQTEHLYLTERKCRSCGETKDLIDGFYKMRKNKYNLSSYSYECKECSIKRVISNRMTNKVFDKWEYPDW